MAGATGSWLIAGAVVVEAAAANGWIDRERVLLEALTSIKRRAPREP